MNQKGFILTPFIFWAIVVTIVGIVVVKSGVVSIVPSESPNPVSTNPLLIIPTQKPVVSNQQVEATTARPVITHDGSRTGPIVDYFELCTGKTIKVYENERIPYKRITGETIYSTKADIKCYENQINQLKESVQSNQPYTPPSNGKPLISCVVTYTCTGNSFTYQVDQNLCWSFQQQAIALCNSSSKSLESLKASEQEFTNIMNQKFHSTYTAPTITVPPFPTLSPEIPESPCTPVPPGFGGSPGHYDKNGYPCAN